MRLTLKVGHGSWHQEENDKVDSSYEFSIQLVVERLKFLSCHTSFLAQYGVKAERPPYYNTTKPQ